MDRVIFLSREKAQARRPAPRTVLISITDKSEVPLVPKEGWQDVLHLRFHDMREFSLGLDEFTPAMAQQILLFADKHQAARELVVHCHMGVSRSASVAIFLSEKYSIPCFRDEVQLTRRSWPHHNPIVLSVLEAANQASDAEI